MDWSKLKIKNLVIKHDKASQVLLHPSPTSSEENEVHQSLLAKSEKSCLVKNDEKKQRGDPSRRVRWKDENGTTLVQVKLFQPDFDVYDDDSSDDDVDFTDFCNCTVM